MDAKRIGTVARLYGAGTIYEVVAEDNGLFSVIVASSVTRNLGSAATFRAAVLRIVDLIEEEVSQETAPSRRVEVVNPENGASLGYATRLTPEECAALPWWTEFISHPRPDTVVVRFDEGLPGFASRLSTYEESWLRPLVGA